MVFRFQNLSVFQNNEKVVSYVSGEIGQGEILMIIGHERCGHSLLLSTLAGRCPLYEGDITIDEQTVPYSALSNTSAYVTSTDLFLPTLTVGENLRYSGLLRLPQLMHERDKNKIIQNTEQLIGLHIDTKTPTMFATKLTKKCLSIACELFQPADVLLIDEPFKDLNYDESKTLVTIFTMITKRLKKSIILDASTPPSHVLGMATKLICLSNGQIAYQGVPSSLADFLQLAGFQCSKLQSPMDLLMELTLDTVSHTALVNLSNRLRVDEGTNKVVWLKSTQVAHEQNGNTMNQADEFRETFIDSDVVCFNGEDKVHIEKRSLVDLSNTGAERRDFNTSFCHQVSVLLARNFHNARRRMLSPISLVQNGYILLLCVLVWWRTPRTEETIKDRLGLFFFTTVQWAFFALLDAILTFPKELKVIQKERKYKLYKTSAFCIAKTVSEFPLAILQPCVYLIVIYWVANLNSPLAFIGSLGVLIIDVIAAQSVGLLLGTALNPPWTVIVVPLGLLSMMLWGGSFSSPPKWLQWGKYASYFTYGLHAFVTLEFTNADPIRCGVGSMVPICNTIDPATNATATHFPSDVILAAQGITWSPIQYSSILIGVAIVTRVLWYIVLRQKRG